MDAHKIIKKAEFSLSTAIFQNRRLSFLESIVVYLKEIQKLRYVDIATLINRDQRTVFTAYQRACKKLKNKPFIVDEKPPVFYIPIKVVQDRSLSIMEVVVEYLLSLGLRNSEIAKLLARSPKTTHTVHTRVKAKRDTKKKNKK